IHSLRISTDAAGASSCMAQASHGTAFLPVRENLAKRSRLARPADFHFNIKAYSRRSRKQGVSQSFIATSFKEWLTKCPVPVDWAAAVETLLAPCDSRVLRVTRSAAGRLETLWHFSRNWHSML